MKLLNAFSLAMLPQLSGVSVSVTEITLAQAQGLAEQGLQSYVGHAAACSLFTALLGVPVAENRVSSKLACGEVALVGQYTGPRLPEGATTLPEGAAIAWCLVRVTCEQPS